MSKRYLTITLMTFISAAFIFITSPQTISAVPAQTPLKTVLDGTSSNPVPSGINNISDWFSLAKIPGKDNVSEILNPNSGVNKTDQTIIKLTELNKTSSYGGVWSNATSAEQPDTTKQNYIDVTKKQTVSMWMYFGGPSMNSNFGDGMAFVLHNSGQGINTFNTNATGTSGVGGQTLGVWGSTSNGVTTQQLADRGIKNSWALEFDTFYNNGDGGIDSNFDSNLGSIRNTINHMASNYPGSADSYSLTDKGPILIHQGIITSASGNNYNFLTDGKWHHLTITWTPAKNDSVPKLTYDYDDINMDGTPNSGHVSKTVDMDMSKFNLGSNTKLYWGFTGSTGSETENNLIIFESIPSIAEADVDSKIYDVTQNNKLLTEDTSDNSLSDTVNDGDELNLTYNLKYLSGSQPWTNIKADINLPTNIDYTSAMINYTTKSGDHSNETITLDSSNPTNITQTLSKSLDDKDITDAQIIFNGTAKGNVGSDGKTIESTSVATQHASFDGDNLDKDTMTTPFKIAQAKKITLTNTDDLNKTLNIGQSTTLNGQIDYSTSTAIDPNNFQVHTIVNDSPTETVTNMNLIADGTTTFKFPISASDLKQGKNTIKVYVTDNYNNVSNIITYTITLTGDLQVNAQSSHFQTVQDFPATRTIQRSNDWSVNVVDSRAKGSTWTLQANAQPMTNNSDKNKTWNGEIIFIDANGNSKSITNNLVSIASGTKTTEESQTFNINSQWAKDKGILLKQAGYQPQGSYSAKITWTVSDGLSNN